MHTDINSGKEKDDLKHFGMGAVKSAFTDFTSLDGCAKANQFIHLYCGGPLMLCLLLFFLIMVLIIVRYIIQCTAVDLAFWV